MNLVIVESPNKVKTIKKYLGNDFEVKASVGHIVKMLATGTEKLGIDFESWEPIYKIEPDKKEIVEELKKLSKKAEVVYIATDPDREGEAIAENLVTFLDIKDKYKRIKYNEITKNAVIASLSNATEIDENLVKAQKSRRMLDRIIGFKLTNLMVQKMNNYTVRPTAGRVQSIALKLVVDKEQEIKAFEPILYSTIDAIISEQYIANLFMSNTSYPNKEWIDRKEADVIYPKLNGDLVVENIKVSTKSDAKITPLKQSILYKKSDMSSKSVQSASQRLYEGYGDGGLISYPRTDSTRLSETFLTEARKFIKTKYGSDYIAKDIKGFSGDQDAHEAIRPTDIALTPEIAKNKYNLSSSEFKVYSLIYKTTLESIMNVPKREITRFNFKNNGYDFKLTASKIIFDGYLILDNNKKTNSELPDFKIGDKLSVKEYVRNNKETKPPARYTDGSLIQKLDEIKVGRPSTFASTISKIIDRNFVEKEGKSLKATEFGTVVIDKLIKGFPNEVNESYTAQVEAELDSISEGQIEYKYVMEEFWNRFNESYHEAQENMEKTTLISNFVGEECPNNDGGQLVFKVSRKTKEKFIGCEKYPECDYTRNIKKPSRFSFLKKIK